MSERESSEENALNAAGDYIRRHRGKGVPAALVLALLGGAVYAQNLNGKVDVVVEQEIPALKKTDEEIKEDIKGIQVDIRDIREGETRYQKERKEDIWEIKRALGLVPRNLLPPAPRTKDNR